MHSFDEQNNEFEFVKVAFIYAIYLHHLIIKWKMENLKNDESKITALVLSKIRIILVTKFQMICNYMLFKITKEIFSCLYLIQEALPIS